MRDEKLSELLAKLPQEGASEDFSHRVLQRIRATAGGESPPPRRRHFRQLQRAALALAICLALAGGFWSRQRDQARTQALAENLAALQMETAALKAELETLRRIKSSSRPTMYLGGSETFGVILDLNRLSMGGAYPEGAYPEGEVEVRPAVTNQGPGHHL